MKKDLKEGGAGKQGRLKLWRCGEHEQLPFRQPITRPEWRPITWNNSSARAQCKDSSRFALWIREPNTPPITLPQRWWNVDPPVLLFEARLLIKSVYNRTTRGSDRKILEHLMNPLEDLVNTLHRFSTAQLIGMQETYTVENRVTEA